MLLKSECLLIRRSINYLVFFLNISNVPRCGSSVNLDLIYGSYLMKISLFCGFLLLSGSLLSFKYALIVFLFQFKCLAIAAIDQPCFFKTFASISSPYVIIDIGLLFVNRSLLISIFIGVHLILGI